MILAVSWPCIRRPLSLMKSNTRLTFFLTLRRWSIRGGARRRSIPVVPASSVLLLERITETLAGRAAMLKLLPPSSMAGGSWTARPAPAMGRCRTRAADANDSCGGAGFVEGVFDWKLSGTGFESNP